MAFERTNAKLTNLISETNEVHDKKERTEISSKLNKIPDYKDEKERTKNFTFTLQPSVREKLVVLSKENGYPSSSKFLNDLIKNM